MIPEYSLTGKSALVTGASRSIGRATAIALAEAGADVVVCARSQGDLRRVVSEIEKLGRRAVAVRCDVSREDDVVSCVDTCVERFGRVDIAVANAGIFPDPKPPEEITLGEWNNTVAIDLTGVMLTCVAAGRQMIRAGGGSIVTISSVEGQVALEGDFPYTAAKHGVLGITRSLAVEWAKHGVRVNAVCPGFTVRDDEPLLNDEAVNAILRARTPMGRWGSAREIALAVAFLASPAANYVTGAALAVDGGWLAL